MIKSGIAYLKKKKQYKLRIKSVINKSLMADLTSPKKEWKFDLKRKCIIQTTTLEDKRQQITEESTRDIEDTIRRLNIPLHGIKGGKERKNGAETIYEENV